MKRFLISIVALVAAMGAWAQEAGQNPMLQPLPNDPAVWIVYDVGAIQEEDDQ